MTNFVLIYSGGTPPQTPAEQEAMMAAWGAWYGKMGEAVTDGGNPFSGAKQITGEGVAEGHGAGERLTGYTIISAASLDKAVELVGDHPHTQSGGTVTVYETFAM
ncbi:MAG: hypothetical protein AAF902_12750 [Chloroflexota bacterium]